MNWVLKFVQSRPHCLLMALIWYIPLFMGWQAERVKGSVQAQEYQRVTNEIQTIVQEILGVP